MEKLNDYIPLSPDWNNQRLETLKALMPDLFTNDGKLNLNEFKKLADAEGISETERFEFRWFGKSAAKRLAFSPSSASLVSDPKRSVNPEQAENIIIEGENLEVLKLLSSAYREKIKCIYIDPPYNTGKDFVYSDNYSKDKKAYWEEAGITANGVKIDTNSESSGRFHSNWLDMMYSRLLIARQLLTEDGVIFISIDDNEVHNLRKLCDEVFGEENFLDCIIWKKRYGGGAKEKHLVSLHEYALFYAKDVNQLDDIYIPNNQESIDKYYKFKDENFEVRGPYRTHPLEATKSMGDRKNLIFPIVGPDDENIWPKRQWLWGQERVSSALKKGEIAFLKDKDNHWSVHTKQYLKDEEGNLREIKAFSVIDDIYTQHGTNEQLEIFGNAQVFSFPKPSSFIKKLLQIGCNGDSESLILDFFAGSGSTGQAVTELNQEDGGNRKYILVQLPEATDEKSEAYKADFKKISDITIERNKRVIEKMLAEKKNAQPELLSNDEESSTKGLGFKVFKLVKSNFPRVEFVPDPEKAEEENIELLKKYITEKESQLVTAFNRDDLMTEILLKRGFTLNYTLTKRNEFKENDVFHATDGETETLICLDHTLDPETVEHFKANQNEKFICLERALNTTTKWHLKQYLREKLWAF